MLEWVPKPAIIPRHLLFSATVLAFAFVTSLYPFCSTFFLSWMCALPHLLWFTLFKLCSMHPVSVDPNFISFFFKVMYQGFPGERCKCNIFKRDVFLLGTTHTGLGTFDTEGYWGHRENSPIFRYLSFLQGKNGGLKPGFLTPPCNQPFTSYDTKAPDSQLPPLLRWERISDLPSRSNLSPWPDFSFLTESLSLSDLKEPLICSTDIPEAPIYLRPST